MTIRVLITGVGGPSGEALVENLRGSDMEVFAGDFDRYAPGLLLVARGNRCHLPPPDDPAYLSELFAVCLRHRIDLIVPCTVDELSVIDVARAPFAAAGLTIVAATAEQLALARSPRALYRAVEGVVPTPRTWTRDELWQGANPSLPLELVTADDGHRRAGVVLSRMELSALALEADDLLREVLPGAEVVVDTLCGAGGELRAAVAREVHRSDRGLSHTERTVVDRDLVAAAAAVVERLGHPPVASLRFLRDRAGVAHLVGLDLLPSPSAGLLRAAGVDGARLLVLDAVGLLEQGHYPLAYAELGAARIATQRIVDSDEIRAAEQEPWQPLGMASSPRLLH